MADMDREPGSEWSELDTLLAEMTPVEAAAFEDAERRTAIFRAAIRHRKDRGLSQKSVAQAMRTTQSAVSDLESERVDARLSTIQRYLAAVGCELVMEVRPAAHELADSGDTADTGVRSLAREASPIVVDAGVGPILKALFQAGGDARPARSPAELTTQTALTHNTVGEAVEALSLHGWVHPVGETGQSAAAVELNADRGFVIGLSLRADHVIGVVTNLRTEVALRTERRNLTSAAPAAVVTTCADLVRTLLGPEGDRKQLIGIGVELAGLVEPASGVVRFAPDLEPEHPEWRGFNFEAELQAATGIRTVVENDANALAVHEYLSRGDTADLAIVLMSDSGAGIGSGLVSGGRLIRGHNGIAGELGHVVVEPGGRPCRCSSGRGCLETVASSVAITRDALADRDEGETLQDVARLVARGDERATAVVDRAGRLIGDALVTSSSVLASERIVLYGPPELTDQNVFASARTFVRAIDNRLCKAWFAEFGYKAEVVPKEFDEDAEAKGAAAVAVIRFLEAPMRWLSEPNDPPRAD
jgi:predicted NBD/HSP70 family sugar kinase/transcriptional regulator with XRE-family HTH domain